MEVRYWSLWKQRWAPVGPFGQTVVDDRWRRVYERGRSRRQRHRPRAQPTEASLGGKWLELLSEIAPGLKRAALMFNPDTSTASAYVPSFETAARSLKVVPITAPVHSDAEIETAIVALGREPGGGLVVMPDFFMTAHRGPIILAAARNNVPAVYYRSEFARDGGLLSYGVDNVDNWRRAATYVDRILRGAKPGDLPVQLPTKHAPGVRSLPSGREGLGWLLEALVSARGISPRIEA
jgi:hypothetical protein